LIEGRPKGIVALLDEESIRPGDKSDGVWLDKLGSAFQGHAHFKVCPRCLHARTCSLFPSMSLCALCQPSPLLTICYQARSGAGDKSVPEGCFMLVHYAGTVTYNVAGFLDKNTDTLFKDLARVMYTASNPILKVGTVMAMVW
jgi:myosin-1